MPRYGILPNQKIEATFLVGLLNSLVVDFFHHQVATQMRGGWFSYESRFIKRLPIVLADSQQQEYIIRFVSCLLWLNQHYHMQQNSKDFRDSLMIGYFEQILNGMVYELYFPDDLHKHGLHIFKLIEQSDLPSLTLFLRNSTCLHSRMSSKSFTTRTIRCGARSIRFSATLRLA
ncbi:hypothetical protein NKDENANG_02884 [Candidatus Entotheonellaceae bacterium PAL068K]